MSPYDYRPCTLLGAVFFQLRQLTTGHDWYRKAEARGADRVSVDQEIMAVLEWVSKEVRERVVDFLLAADRERFTWLTRQA